MKYLSLARHWFWLAPVVAGLVFVGSGIYMIAEGNEAKDEVQDALVAENIVTSEDASIPNVLADDADTAKAQSEAIKQHTLELTGGETYATIDRYVEVALSRGSREVAFVEHLYRCVESVPVLGKWGKDDPNTHLELTMIHEVMVLDHGGPDLALILYANALKMGVFAALILDLLVPRNALQPWVSAAVLVGGLVAAGVAVGVVESTIARLRLPKVPLFIAGGTALGLFGLILLLQ